MFFIYKNYLLKIDKNIECDKLVISNFVNCLKQGIITKKEYLKNFIENNKVSLYILPVNHSINTEKECKNFCKNHQENPYILNTLQNIIEISPYQLVFKKIKI